MDDDRLLDRLVVSIIKTAARARTYGGKDKWPLPLMHIWECDIYYIAHLFEDLHNLLRIADERGLTDRDIAQAYNTTLTIWRLPFLFLGRSLAHLSREEAVRIGYRVARILNVFYKDDFSYRITRPNPFWDELRSRDEYRATEFTPIANDPAGRQAAKLLSHVAGKLYLYLELAYNDLPDSGMQIHGPYEAEHKMVVRDYFELSPHIWRFSEEFPYSWIQFRELYPSMSRIGVDMRGIIYSTRPMSKMVQAYAASIGGNQCDIRQLTQLSIVLDKFIERGAREKSNASRQDIIRAFYLSRATLLRPLARALDITWQPSPLILDKIARGALSPAEQNLLVHVMSGKFTPQQRFDPRIPMPTPA